MPNAPCVIRQAATAFVLGTHAVERDASKVVMLMSSVGEHLRLFLHLAYEDMLCMHHGYRVIEEHAALSMTGAGIPAWSLGHITWLYISDTCILLKDDARPTMSATGWAVHGIIASVCSTALGNGIHCHLYCRLGDAG